MFRPRYVLCLARLVAGTEQDDEQGPFADEIDAVPRPVVDPHLTDTFAHGANVTWVAKRKAPDPDIDLCSRRSVAKGIEPRPVMLGLSNLDHICSLWDTTVASTLGGAQP